jgi:2-succinyl-5-enolpyruvyl-6-hydroxy-3-cyclohexene-1-carboxylate synthase
MAFADSPIEDSSHHDERSASFYAIGLARITGRPVAVVTTSGTAATELHPAIAEAEASGVPIIALTADRPREFIGRAAPQTIDQRELFGPMVRLYDDVDVESPADAGTAARLGADLVAAALGSAPGPVHCNLRFREPLVLDDDPVAVPAGAAAARADVTPDPSELERAAELLAAGPGLIVAGPMTWRSGAESIGTLARTWGWPVMADPLSGLRAGLGDTTAIVGSDLLAAAGWLDRNPPAAVLRFGTPPTSKALSTWLGAHPETPQVVVAPWGRPDPTGSAAMILRADPGPAAAALMETGGPTPGEWVDSWTGAQETAIAAARNAIGDIGFPSEPGVVGALERSLRAGSVLWVGSSMPIRDVDAYLGVTDRGIDILGHRGANGIDGLVSAALGSAATGRPVVAVLGDVAMLHDVGSLATLARIDADIVVVVVNNDGGGIFHFLPQEGHRHFERHFGTPHGLSFSVIAAGFGVDADTANTTADIDAAVRAGGGPRLIEVLTDRRANLAHHHSIGEAVRAALA